MIAITWKEIVAYTYKVYKRDGKPVRQVEPEEDTFTQMRAHN